MSFRTGFRAFAKRARALLNAKNGNVAMIFGLSLVPITAGAGIGLDFARAMVVRTRLSEALDAAGLALGSTTGLTTAQIQTMAQSYFNANYTADRSLGTPAAVTVVTGGATCPAGAGNSDCIVLSSSVPMPTTLMNVVGIRTMNISYSSQVVWGQTKLWVGLALDNTGSMSQTSGGLSKISAEQTATKNLLAMLKGVALNPADVEASLVPFTTIVKVGTANKAAAWLTYAAWDAVGTGYGGYFLTTTGAACVHTGSNGATCKWKATNATHSSWTGCVMDRDQSYDTNNTTPGAVGPPSTLFQAAPTLLYSNSNWDLTQCTGQQTLIGLSDVTVTAKYNAMVTAVNNMVAAGATNQTIGLAWAWQTLTDGAPENAGTLPRDTREVIILLSDGLNTQDRWTGDGSNQDASTDARMALTCQNVKAAGITVYAVFVDLNGTQGNSTVLQNCASDASKYFDLTTSADIITAFNQIGTQITQLRVAR